MASFLKPVGRNAGLGDPPDPYYNNIPESAKAIIKTAVEHEPKEMSTNRRIDYSEQKGLQGSRHKRRPICACGRREKLGNSTRKIVQHERQPKRASFAKIFETRDQRQESDIAKDDNNNNQFQKLDECKIRYLSSALRQTFNSPSFESQWEAVRTKINAKCRGKRRNMINRLKTQAIVKSVTFPVHFSTKFQICTVV